MDLLIMLNGLDLFSGIGGMSIALREWVRPIAYCEIDPYCQGVLLSRMHEKSLPLALIWDDIRELGMGVLPSGIEMLYGGFPCQGISVAGHGRGLADERSGLFFEIIRLAKEIKPSLLFLENVPAITKRGGVQVIGHIAEMGYDCRWCCISAESLGALHKRDRWFLLAHSNNNGSFASERRNGIRKCFVSGKGSKEQKEDIGQTQRTSSISSDVAHTESKSLQQEYSSPLQECKREETWRRNSRDYWPFESREHWQETVRGVCRTSDGISFQVDRIKALGNAVVPMQAREAFKILMGIA